MSREAAEFIVNTSLETIPPQVVSHAKLHILDTIGTTLGGFRTTAGKTAARFAEGLGRSNQSTILLSGTKASMVAATFANCVAASALDYDDGHLGSGFHPGSVIVPPALAVAEATDSSGKEMLEAVVVGYEVGLRAGLMITRRAGHPFPAATGGMAPFSGAAVASKLLKLDAGRAAQAQGIGACTYPLAMDGGYGNFNAMVKEAIGWGGMSGVAAALLAQRGYTGGFTPFNARVDGRDEHPYYPFDGKNWELLKTYFKFYPACRFTHAPADLVLRLVRQNNLRREDITRIIVEVSWMASTLNTYEPGGLEHAQYSIPFVIGACLVYGKAGPDEVSEEKLREPAILEQARKVFVKNSPDMTELFPRFYPARARIETKDGRFFEMQKNTCTGDYDEPMSPEQIKEKFSGVVEPVIGKDGARRVVQMVDNLEQVRSVRDLIAELRARVPAR
ncbi:MAG: MmgE/PrpD family protein [Chloroflexi bacterium]|nr:MmgE/PrpD family protein [Chloroflexota bacterium]